MPLHSLILIGLLTIVIYQDFRARAISVWLIPALIAIVLWIGLTHVGWKITVQYFLTNASFISIQLLVLFFYFSIKMKKWTNIIDSWLGLGDVLFFVCLCGLFSPVNFIAFFISSIFGVLVFFLLIKAFIKKLSTIPLAGGMALFLILLIIIVELRNGLSTFYHDEYILEWLLNNMSIF